MYTRYRYAVPDRPKTPHRTFRADDDPWIRFCASTELADTDASAALRSFMDWYNREPKAVLPKRPNRATDTQIKDWRRRHPPRNRRDTT